MYKSVTLKDLMKYYGCSLTTAKIKLKHLRTACNKHRITVYDLAIHEGYPPEMVKEYLDNKE